MNALLLAPALVAALQNSAWRQYADPAEAGYSAEALAAAWEAADRAGSAAVVVVAGGHVLAAWGAVDGRHECHSVRKSLTSALVGRAIAEGLLDPEATLAELGVDDLQPLDETERGARLIDLMAARSGVYHPAAKEPSDMAAERPARGSHAPGEHFFYNNWDFNVPTTLLERATGKDLFALFDAWLAEPLGMQDFEPARDGLAQLEPRHSRFPAHAFRLSARDLARFGQLYLQHGEWDGRQVVPAEWVAASTRPHSDLGRGRGYGLMWWTYAPGSLAGHPTLDAHGCFAAVGTGGQIVMVVPGLELVFVHRADTSRDVHVPGGVVWDLAERIAAARTGEPVDDPELVELAPEPFTDRAPPPPDLAPVALAPELLEPLAGTYAFDAFEIEVYVHAGRLFAQRSDGDEAELLPLGESRFALWFPAYEVHFERDDAGRATAATLRTPRGAMTGRRVP